MKLRFGEEGSVEAAIILLPLRPGKESPNSALCFRALSFVSGILNQTRKIMTSVAFMRAAAVWPRFSCISLAERAVMIEVIC